MPEENTRTVIALPKIVRYIISGGTGAAVNIGTLFVCTHYFQVWYLASSVIAFFVAFLVSFTLQRQWTFDHKTNAGLARHTVQYFAVAFGNVFLNTALVYGLVEYMSVWYIAAQIIAGAVIAFVSYFAYRRIFI